MMISLKNHKIIDLTAEIVSRVTRLDGSVEEETVNERDNTIEHLVGSNKGTIYEWPIGPVSGHRGTHIQLGVEHNYNWKGLPKGMLGLWDMPLRTYYGEAVICNL